MAKTKEIKMSWKNSNNWYIQNKTARRLVLALANNFPKFRKWFKAKLIKKLRNQLILDAENDCAWHEMQVGFAYMADSCARCRQDRSYHWHGDCYHDSGAACSEFVEEGQMTSEMIADWKEKVRIAWIKLEAEHGSFPIPVEKAPRAP